MIFEDWIKKNNKKILISNSNSFSNKIIMNYCVGFNTYINNIKTLTIKDILNILFISFKSINDNKFIIINDTIASTIVEYLLRKEKNTGSTYIYDFIPNTSIGGLTSDEVYKAFTQIRLGKMINSNPNAESLLKLSYDYDEFLENNNYYDYPKLLDFGLEYLFNHTKEEIIDTLGFGTNVDFGIFDNVKLTYKEAFFIENLEKVFNTKIEKISYTYENNKIQNNFVKCYGLYNEVDFIVNKIINDNINPSDINIYYTDNAYENFIRAIFERRNINFRFNKAYAIATNLIQLFKDLITFYKNDYKYEDLYNVCKNPIFTFDKIIEANNLDKNAYNKPLKSFFEIVRENICNSKERYIEFINSYNKNAKNDLFVNSFLKDLIDVTNDEKLNSLYLNIYNLIKKYSYVNNEYISLKDKLDDLVIIFDIMSLINDGLENNLDYIETHLESLTYSEKEDDYAINIIKLNDYDVIDRKYNFVLGLSSSQTKKKEVESAIFSDNDYLNMLSNDYYISLAKNLNLEFSDVLNKTFKSTNDAIIYFEYSCYDTIEFKPQAPSIFYLDKLGANTEIYYTYKPDYNNYYTNKDEVINKVKIYKNKKDEHLSNTNNLNFVDASDKTLDLNLKPDEVKVYESLNNKIDNVWSLSASGLGTLVTCPMCYCYQYLKFIPNLDFKEPKSYAWLDPLSKGNLFHHTLEYYSNNVFKNDELDFNENEFNKAFEKAISEAVLEIPYPNEKIFENEYKLNKEVAFNYINKLHNFYNENASLNKFYKNIGNELDFGKDKTFKAIVKDSFEIEIDNNIYKTNYELYLNGSIDRLDGYLDGDTLHLLIIDYKTSKEANLKKEIKEYTKIQHYIYAIAAFNYFNQEKDEIEKIFNHKITNCVIDDMEYHLPFSDVILRWSEGFGNKKFDSPIPNTLEDVKFPDKIKEAIGIVSLFRDGVNIDVLYNELKKYYDKYKLKNPNVYSNYKHICRYEIDSYVEEDNDGE